MCCSNGSLFYKKSLIMGTVFYKEILKFTWVQFSDWAKIFGFSYGENPQNHNICEKWAYFSRKILHSGYPFLTKWPLKMGRGFEARAAHPCPNQIWVWGGGEGECDIYLGSMPLGFGQSLAPWQKFVPKTLIVQEQNPIHRPCFWKSEQRIPIIKWSALPLPHLSYSWCLSGNSNSVNIVCIFELLRFCALSCIELMIDCFELKSGLCLFVCFF